MNHTGNVDASTKDPRSLDAGSTDTDTFGPAGTLDPVSYTHLDVYKRQPAALVFRRSVLAFGAMESVALGEDSAECLGPVAEVMGRRCLEVALV